MSDPKPYTMEDLDKELSPYGGARGDALAHYMGDLEPLRVLATVEALERAEKERDEQLEDSERIIAALVKERDEARASATRGWEQADSLHLTVATLTAERDALKAALREMVERGEGCPACGDGTRGGCGCRHERAREALEEVES